MQVEIKERIKDEERMSFDSIYRRLYNKSEKLRNTKKRGKN